ncbi:hypothetical protein CI109_104528 [Kwoniella shandongensis]|uniref:Uncharacterized protein n=1 Tax=Kwoniella shandongensis TaxID=1734106 RepID=A0A5M6BTG0_9TREE|nr:uncharacterized protein CI109_005581 [Kwoniella shandongensis]KAA5526146.1 hypothetical protein CI109_005581 [Kwoniella shandongensis]
MFAPSHTLPLLLSLITATSARQITVINSCASTIWPGLFTAPSSIQPSQPTGWELVSGQKTVFQVDENWTAGRIWARTGCVVQDGTFQCLTGNCGSGGGGVGLGGDITCTTTDQVPATLAEFTLNSTSIDNYDISLVDGFNIPLNIEVSDKSCTSPKCDHNINMDCPPLLRTGLDKSGKNLGCLQPCNAGFGQEAWGNRACCTGAYADPNLCQSCGVDYYDLFKKSCPNTYAYAYDEKSHTALWTCASNPDYTVEFCPSGSDYVGPKIPSNKYVSATATCANLATNFTSMFTVGPSPTKTASIGTLDVVATVAPNVDGAAAAEISAGTVSSTPVPAGAASSSSSTYSSGLALATSTSPAAATTQHGAIGIPSHSAPGSVTLDTAPPAAGVPTITVPTPVVLASTTGPSPYEPAGTSSPASDNVVGTTAPSADVLAVAATTAPGPAAPVPTTPSSCSSKKQGIRKRSAARGGDHAQKRKRSRLTRH